MQGLMTSLFGLIAAWGIAMAAIIAWFCDNEKKRRQLRESTRDRMRREWGIPATPPKDHWTPAWIDGQEPVRRLDSERGDREAAR